MSEKKESVKVVVKQIHTSYEVFTINKEDLQEYLTSLEEQGGAIGWRTVFPQIWKWIQSKSKDKKNKHIFTKKTEDYWCEYNPEPLETQHKYFATLLADKVHQLVRR